MLVTPPLVCKGSPSYGVSDGDTSSGLGGELVSASVAVGDCHLGIRVRVQWWLLITVKWKGDWHTVECFQMWPSMEAAQGCLIIGDWQPGLKMHVDAVEVVLQREVSLESLLDVRDSVEAEQGLSALIFSGVPGVGGACWIPGEIQVPGEHTFPITHDTLIQTVASLFNAFCIPANTK